MSWDAALLAMGEGNVIERNIMTISDQDLIKTECDNYEMHKQYFQLLEDKTDLIKILPTIEGFTPKEKGSTEGVGRGYMFFHYKHRVDFIFSGYYCKPEAETNFSGSANIFDISSTGGQDLATVYGTALYQEIIAELEEQWLN